MEIHPLYIPAKYGDDNVKPKKVMGKKLQKLDTCRNNNNNNNNNNTDETVQEQKNIHSMWMS